MKKLVLLIFTVCMGGGIAASAQEVSQQKLDSLNQALSDISARVKETEAAESNRAIWKDRSKYFNLNYVNQKLSPDIDGWDKLGGGELKSDFGAAIVWGKTYYLHKKPLAGMIKFGIDWSWRTSTTHNTNSKPTTTTRTSFTPKRPTSSNTVCRSARR